MHTLVYLLHNYIDEEVVDLVERIHDIYKSASERLLVLDVDVRLE